MENIKKLIADLEAAAISYEDWPVHEAKTVLKMARKSLLKAIEGDVEETDIPTVTLDADMERDGVRVGDYVNNCLVVAPKWEPEPRKVLPGHCAQCGNSSSNHGMAGHPFRYPPDEQGHKVAVGLYKSAEGDVTALTKILNDAHRAWFGIERGTHRPSDLDEILDPTKWNNG